MNLINKILVSAYRKKLTRAAQESTEIMQRYKDENVFKSGTMRELLSDVFEYKGTKPNTVLIKDKKTGAPVEATVKFYTFPDKYDERAITEKFLLFNDKGKRIGKKEYYLRKNSDGELRMLAGEMWNFRKTLFGIGFRLDQLHIERALQLGFDSVPRDSLAQATLFHAKMGFLPIEENLVQIFSLRQAKKVVKERLAHFADEIAIEPIPIIKEEGGAFFVDLNRTRANYNMQKSKKLLEETNARSIHNQLSGSSMLRLDGEQLERWRKIVKEHPVLSKMNFKLPEY